MKEEATPRGRQTAAAVPSCRFCGHTDAEPKRDEMGDELGWATKARNCCTGRQCVMAADREKRTAALLRYRRSLDQAKAGWDARRKRRKKKGR